MSEPRLPPPLPPTATPSSQPIPVQPLDEPSNEGPFHADEFGQFRHRPGIITAISVLSITIGSLGMITGGLSALYAGIFFLVAKQSVAMQRTAAIASQQPAHSPAIANDAAVDPNSPPTVEERGLDQPTRQVIINVLAEQRPLNDSRRRELHALLAKTGQDVFINSGGGVSSADIRRAISQSGQLPSASDGASVADSSNGPDYFVISTGRIEVTDDRAVFEPSDPSQETVRVRAPPMRGKNIASVAGSISMQDVHFAVDMVDRLSANRITAQQRRTLTAEFSSGSGLLQATPGMPINSQLVASMMQPDGSVLVITSHGQLQVSSTGLVQRRFIYGNATTQPTMAVTPFGVAGNRRSTIAGAAVVVVVAEGALSVLLSIYLLVIGIFTLRQSPRGRALHVIYALVKLPLAIACGLGWCWIINGFFPSMLAPGVGGSTMSIRAVVLAMVTIIALLYPIGLLITFATPPVKRYYDSARSEGERN